MAAPTHPSIKMSNKQGCPAVSLVYIMVCWNLSNAGEAASASLVSSYIVYTKKSGRPMAAPTLSF